MDRAGGAIAQTSHAINGDSGFGQESEILHNPFIQRTGAWLPPITTSNLLARKGRGVSASALGVC